MEEKELPKELQDALLSLVDQFAIEDRGERESRLRELRFYELYFNGYQTLFWNATLMDYASVTTALKPENDSTLYAKPINIVKAHGESIIAATTAQAPKTPFSPDNAENPDDVQTAKAFTGISRLIELHNNSPLIFMRMMFLAYTQGTIFLYNYNKRDKVYGMAKVASYKPVEETQTDLSCPNCAYPLDQEAVDPETGMAQCDQCEAAVQPVAEEVKAITIQETIEEVPKAREILEVYGTMHVKIPLFAGKQSEIKYLTLECEYDTALIKSMYPEMRDKIGPSPNTEEIDGRMPFGYWNTKNIITVRQTWIRPWAFYSCEDKIQEQLSKLYPNGVRLVSTNDHQFLEANDEALDDHWTITEDPLSNRIWTEPLCKSVIPLQQMLNEVVSIILETLEQGIPMTFYDTEIISGEALNESRAEVGLMYPAVRPQGMGLEGAFYQTRATSLPAEIYQFLDQIQRFAEFVLGSFPSIYGGSNQEGSKTLGEYERSRVSALQRLSLKWRTIKSAWGRMMHKSCEEYRQNMIADESFTQKAGDTYSNVWIKKSDTQGKVGGVEPDVDESFPLTWSEISARMLELIGQGNETINTAIFDLENVGLVKRVIGFPSLYIPGEDQRDMQLAQIMEMVKAAPIDGQPTIQPDFNVENQEICIKTTQAWAASPLGQFQKEWNQEGYANVMAQLMLRQQFVQEQMAQQQAAELAAKGGGAVKPKETEDAEAVA